MAEHEPTRPAGPKEPPRGRPEDAPRCPECGYLLYGIELTRCPECGIEVTGETLVAARELAASNRDALGVVKRQVLIYRCGRWAALGGAGVLALLALLHPGRGSAVCLIMCGAPLTVLALLLRAAYDWPPHWAMAGIGAGWVLAALLLLLLI